MTLRELVSNVDAERFAANGLFRMRVEPVMDEVTTATMKHNDEGDEIGWEEHNVDLG